jgi:hypothetical protein
MNTPPTTAQPLDHFESALLGELREHVATRSAPDVAAAPSRRHRRRWAVGLAAAAATATAVVIASPGGPGASPAYAVSESADGDVVVTVHRLEDAAGLEAALREHGIDAEVSFDPDDHLAEHVIQSPDGAPPLESGEGAGGTTLQREPDGSDGPKLESSDEQGPDSGADPSDEAPGDPGGCGSGEPPTLAQDGDDWVLTIPAGSPLRDREVQIATSAGGDLQVAYPGDAPNSYCGVAFVG